MTSSITSTSATRIALLVVSCSIAFSSTANADITSKPCPYSCAKLGLPKSQCRDWRSGTTCYVERIEPVRRSAKGSVICLNSTDGTLVVRTRCLSKKSETQLDYAALIGPQGIQGPEGEDGQLRIYGDGSAGAKSFSVSTTFDDNNPQYTDIVIDSGVTLTVPSGTVLRCTGTFRNRGTISVLPGLKHSAKFAENGSGALSAGSAGLESLGGSGGAGLAAGVAKGLLRVGLLSAGGGYSNNTESDGLGGGNFTVLCEGSISNEGSIVADGDDAAATFFGGGGGGFVGLASAVSINNSGSIFSRGGDGGPFLANDGNNNGYGPGGGGGGGIIHLVAPSIQNSGTTNANGGAGGSAAPAASITGVVYYGGGGGGGAGGAGGSGGAVNPGNIGNNSSSAGASGSTGSVIQTSANPAALY